MKQTLSRVQLWMYKIVLNKHSEKIYNKLEKSNRTQIKQNLGELKAFLSGEQEKVPDIKKLKGKYKGLYCLRSGNYRIIYDFKNQIRVIMIIHIMHRQEDY